MSNVLSNGVYFSANDIVYDWAIAFLNSFRHFNPTLRLILIPFNDSCERLLHLKSTYNFEVWTDPTFVQLEAIGQAFELGHTPTGPFWFRRYSAFWGPLDRFLYLDVRLVVLADLMPIITALDEYGFDFLHFDCALDQVYQPGSIRQSLLQQRRARGFNSGRWASKKGLFTLDEFEQFANEAIQTRDQLNPRNTDQAFINYCCDLKPVQYGHAAEVMGGICQNAWARQTGEIYQKNQKYYLWDYGGQDHQKQVVLLHWAGYRLNALMPHKQIFNHFRFQGYSRLRHAQVFCTDLGKRAVFGAFVKLRQNRIINTFYHRHRLQKKENRDSR